MFRATRLLCLLLLAFTSQGIQAQKIKYDIPEEYRDALSKADYHTFVDLAVKEITVRYPVERVEAGTVTLGGNSGNLFNLHNLLSKCLEAGDRSTWPELMHTHFTNLFADMDLQENLDTKTYAAVEPYLSLRIYPESFAQANGGTELHFPTRTDLEGTITVLMLDLPTTFTAVDLDDFTGWGADTASAFATAQQHVNTQPMDIVTDTVNAGEPTAFIVTYLENPDYASSYTLDLCRTHPELIGAWGAVVAIPNKGLVVTGAIDPERPLDFVNFIRTLASVNRKFNGEHPQPVSDQFYWLHKGRFTRIPFTEEADGTVQVTTPPALGMLMAGPK